MKEGDMNTMDAYQYRIDKYLKLHGYQLVVGYCLRASFIHNDYIEQHTLLKLSGASLPG